MSYQDGLAAINLEMPKRIPRTEYSGEFYFDLMKQVTGINVLSTSSDKLKLEAELAFRKAWNYDFSWNVMVGAEYAFKDYRTKMGHANFVQNGLDFNDDITQVFTDYKQVLDFDPYEIFKSIDTNKVIKDFENDYKKRLALYPNEINMTGIYDTCVSGLIDLFGWDLLLLAAGMDENKFGEVVNRYSKWVNQYFEALANSNVPIVMIHDDIVWATGPFIHPDWYRKYIFPNIKKNIQPLIEANKKIMFTSDGDFSLFIDDIADCGVNGFILEPLTNMNYIAEKYGKTHVIIGNVDTRTIMLGSKEDIYNEVKRCIDIGRSCPGFFMAIGNHISSNTPIENLLYYNEVYEKLSTR